MRCLEYNVLWWKEEEKLLLWKKANRMIKKIIKKANREKEYELIEILTRENKSGKSKKA